MRRRRRRRKIRCRCCRNKRRGSGKVGRGSRRGGEQGYIDDNVRGYVKDEMHGGATCRSKNEKEDE